MRHWNKNHVKMILDRARARAGNGWNLLGDELKEALADQETFAIIRGQAREAVDIEAMDELYNAVHDKLNI